MAANTQKRTWRRRALTVGAVGTTLVALAGTSWGAAIYNMVPTGNYNPGCSKGEPQNAVICRTDNDYWTIFRENSLTSNEKLRVKIVLDQEYGPTDLSLHYPAEPVWTGDNETDVIYAKGDLSGDAVGTTWCDDPQGGEFECDQHMVRIEPGEFDQGTICHEAGHAVGLVHGIRADPSVSNTHHQLGCMKTPSPTDAVLGSVNRDNINTTY
ncbi:hypothetical protein O7599_31065 [Streptomyces sp. WMMC500]|uniref:hypothetical protein n=1 Tax=Streptomyces sp. WMMC500 TaxID=3015154 RepID=UPI00248B685A|nr:hypothetical protein [Streptomyces sp. WMMC500]WBB59941.1 hypothetical protein O7599_31065 [Streptomyces sp. WMMC500]